jgi:tetratricopeptide (TPR) repeat protein
MAALTCATLVRAQSSAPQTQPAAAAPQDDLKVILSTADQLLKQDQYQAAVKLLAPLAADHPDDGRVHALLGSAYHKLRRYGPAKEHLEKAAKLLPNLPRARLLLGICNYYLGETDESRRVLESVLRDVPNEGHAHYWIGLIEFDADRLEEAERRFRRAVELFAADPRNAAFEASARARLGDIYIRQEKFEPAKGELIKATTLDPNLYNAYFRLARVLTRLGDLEGAKEAMRKHDEIKARTPQQEGFPE